MNVRTVGCCSSTDAVTLCLDSLKMLRLFCLTTLLVLTGETVLAHAAPVERPAISLDISMNNDKDQDFGSLEVKCSLDTNLALMTSLASLAMMGSKLPGNSDSFDELARVNVWSSAPEVADHLCKDRVVVKGCNGQPPCDTPNLVMSWRDQDEEYNFFKCVARGMDSDGKPITVSSAVKPEQENSPCTESKDPVYCELQKMSSKLEVITDTSGKLSILVQALDAKYDSLEKGVEEMGRKFESLNEEKFDSLKRIALLSTARFDVSDVYNDRVYLVTKAEENFNLESANKVCRKSGGYLVEVDDTEEYQFVYDLVSKIGGSTAFFTGGNDVGHKGFFVYYNSKKRVPNQTWKKGPPKFAVFDNQHCMMFSPPMDGVMVCPCYGTGKYVCEVPLSDFVLR